MLALHPADRRGHPGPARLRLAYRLAPVILAGLVLSACVSTPGVPSAPAVSATRRSGFEVGRDTFAFANLVRAESPDQPVTFANYCIVMARAATQFFRFARFAPAEPALSDTQYTALTRQILDLPAWQPPWSPGRRIVIPGYPSLHAFSQAREAAIKASFGSSLPSMVHWRTWRVALPLPPGHDARLARELLDEVDAGRPAPLMITNFPSDDLLNHAVVVFGYRRGSRVVEFLAYDPNDPANPLALHFDPDPAAFWVEPLPYSPPGRVRAFRLYASPLL